MECKGNYYLQNTVFVRRLQEMVCSIKLIEHCKKRLIYGNPVCSVLIRLDEGICGITC